VMSDKLKFHSDGQYKSQHSEEQLLSRSVD
jgi:hypothetical protein